MTQVRSISLREYLAAMIAVAVLLATLLAFHHLSPIRRLERATKITRAVAIYEEGVHLFGREKWSYDDLVLAEQKFRAAAALGLAHGNYGIACVIYRKLDHNRAKEAFNNLAYAVSHHVLEAMPTLAGYYMEGLATAIDRDKAASLIEAAAALTHISPEPASIYSYSEENLAQNLVRESISPSKCGPHLSIHLDERRGLKNVQSPQFDLEHSLDLIIPDPPTPNDK